MINFAPEIKMFFQLLVNAGDLESYIKGISIFKQGEGWSL